MFHHDAILLLLLLLLVVTGLAQGKLIRTVLLVRNSEWGASVLDGKAQSDVLSLPETEAAHVLGQRLRNVYVRSHRLVPGMYDPSKVRFMASINTIRATQLGMAISSGMFQVERGHVVVGEMVPISLGLNAHHEDGDGNTDENEDHFCLAAHPVLVDLPGTLESTLENLHYLVKIDRELDPFDIDLVAEPLLAAVRFPQGVSIEFIDSLQKLAKWARDAKYGDPLAARVRGGRQAYQVLTRLGAGDDSKSRTPELQVMIVTEYAFYTLLEMLTAKSSDVPARVLAVELHHSAATGKVYVQVFKDFIPLALDACAADCELKDVVATLKAKGAFLNDEEWARTCGRQQQKKNQAVVAAAAAAAADDKPPATSTAPVASAAAAADDSSRTNLPPCDSTSKMDFFRGMAGGLFLAIMFVVLVTRTPRGASQHGEENWHIDEPLMSGTIVSSSHTTNIIPRPTASTSRARMGSSSSQV